MVSRICGRGCKCAWWTGLLLIGLMPAFWLMAQPVRDRVLEGAQLYSRDDGCLVVNIDFSFPVRYVRHFPLHAHDELHIELRPIRLNPGDQDVLVQREAVFPENGENDVVEAVVYQGNSPNGPVLHLEFSGPRRAAVSQGGDFRSITVVVPGASSAATCTP